MSEKRKIRVQKQKIESQRKADNIVKGMFIGLIVLMLIILVVFALSAA